VIEDVTPATSTRADYVETVNARSADVVRCRSSTAVT
jgi:hypothetical protein